MAELHDLSAVEQARAIRAREISPVELVEHYLARIERLSDTVGAFVTVTADSALAQAKDAERAVVDGADLPPLHGVPTAIKDLNLTAGVPTKVGSTAFADFVPPIDDHVVTLLRAAGTISLGKTNTPELGLPCYTEPDVAPPARTPWDLSKSAGGSSGGAATAVASGLVPFAQGSDGAGSIRIPSSVCGVFGVKTARGRISRGPLVGDITGLSWDGPIARTVRDAAALLDAMAVPMPGDPHWAPPPVSSFLAAADRDPGRLVVGRYCKPLVEAGVHPDCITAYDEASALIASLGHEVVDIDVPFGADLRKHFIVLWAVGAAGVPIAADREELLRPLTRALRESGREKSGVEFTGALAALQLATRTAVAQTAHCDVVLTPTLAQLPRAIGGFRNDDDPWSEFSDMTAFTPFTAPYNMTGQPAVNLPLYWNAAGLPVGVMLAGRPAGEETLLSLSAQLEAARPWALRKPPVW